MSTPLYRFVSGDVGVYEAVERDCPRTDSRRNGKPDGSWLPKVGAHHPGAISYWTEAGIEKYLRSGLQEWHRRVVSNPIEVVTASRCTDVLYQDEWQILASQDSFTIEDRSPWGRFATLRAGDGLKEKVVVYIVRQESSEPEILVFEHDPVFSDAGIQVPAGTIDDGESPEAAAVREAAEEAGLSGLRVVRKIDEYVLYRATHQQFQRRHVFLLSATQGIPDRWSQKVTGHGVDRDLSFHYYWMPFSQAQTLLAAGFGDSISALSSSSK